MREIVDEVLSELEGEKPFALVTLVSERGSTPRAAGAQMLVRGDGSIAGTIGGGALEATMMEKAGEAIASRRSEVTTLRLAGGSIAEAEMLCGGSAEVLISFVPPGDAALSSVCRGLREAMAAARPARLFMFFAAGRDPVDVDYCLLVEDTIVGEEPCDARELRRLAGKIGVHGTAALPDGRQVHAETVERPSRAVICGAGHVAAALAPVTEHVGFRTTVLDDRAEFADACRFPTASEVVALKSFDGALAEVGVDERCYVVVVTRGHQYDFDVVVQALRTPAAYIGLMSSRTKRQRIETGLREAGFGDADIARVRMPVGLAIGAETPAELAVSIVAEMIEVRAEGA